jgi:hypothetical protein
MALNQFGGIRRSAGQLRPDTAPCGTDDLRVLERHAYGQYRLSDNSRLRRRASGAAEVHTQVTMSVIVPTLTEAVRRIGAQRYDQRDGRDERDQANTEETLAQGGGATCRGTNKRSL